MTELETMSQEYKNNILLELANINIELEKVNNSKKVLLDRKQDLMQILKDLNNT